MEAVIKNAVLAHSYAAESNLCGAQLEAVDLTGQAMPGARAAGPAQAVALLKSWCQQEPI